MAGYRYFFKLSNNAPTHFKKHYCGLAHHAVKGLGKEATVTQVLIRSGMHDTTSKGFKKDPKGFHLTLSIKTADQETSQKHNGVHAYTLGQHDYNLSEVDEYAEVDDAKLNSNGNPLWPDASLLDEFKPGK